jgi:hypothetical protein
VENLLILGIGPLDPRTQTRPGWPSSNPNPNFDTSAPSERIFSHAQRRISEKRTALNLDILADKLFFDAENWEWYDQNFNVAEEVMDEEDK